MKLKYASLFLIFVTGYAAAGQDTDSECTVTIQNGTIFGKTEDTLNPLKKVCAYTAIPFAAPPVGPLRFKPPQPAQAWGTMNATVFPNWCPQSGSPPPGIEISEDCLFLNVYQPKLAAVANSTLPVMIWFHGGAFTGGSSKRYTHVKLLARGDVILVVVHYRLGLLGCNEVEIGFLSTGDGDSVASGNFGLKDQAYSIRWVNENIRAFGGNPGQVTIFGKSAGGRSAIYQLVSPLNKGLIHGVIAQSGSSLVTYDQNPLESAKFMAERFNCSTNSSQVIVDCMRQISWEEIIKKQTEYLKEGSAKMVRADATLTPVVERDIPGAFITKEPLEIIKDGDLDNTIPVILGATKHEGSLPLAGMYLGKIGPLGLDKDPEYMRGQLVPDILKYYGVKGEVVNRAVASTVEMTFLAGVNRSSWDESMPGLVDFMSVFSFKSSIFQTAELLSKRGFPVYLYSFEHHSENTVWPMFFGSRDIPVGHGIMHVDDLIYLFDFPANFSREDESFSNMFCDLWINFANTGNPTPLPSDRLPQWPTYDVVNESYMKLNLTPTVDVDYRSSWRPNGFEWN